MLSHIEMYRENTRLFEVKSGSLPLELHNRGIDYCDMDIGSFLYDVGRYAEMEFYASRAVSLRTGMLGPDHPEILESLKELVDSYSS